jgi:hypothetical protein
MAAVPAQTSGASNVATSTASASMAMYTGAGSAMSPGALVAAVGIAAYVL